MAITLSPETTKQLRASIKRFASEHLEQEIGDLKTDLFLDFVLQEIAPSVYNRAIADAQAHLHAKVSDLESECYQPEMTYWQSQGRGGKGGRGR